MAERVGFEPTCRIYPTIRFRVGAVMTASVPLRGNAAILPHSCARQFCNIYPIAAGSSGSLTITDNGVEVFTIASADIIAEVPIAVGVTCAHDVTISSVPTGGEFGVLWEQGGGA